MGSETRAREPRRGLTFEDVWAALMELRESSKETDRRMKETDRRMKETERILKESGQETDRRIKEIVNSVFLTGAATFSFK
jgi:hypothetical protein